MTTIAEFLAETKPNYSLQKQAFDFSPNQFAKGFAKGVGTSLWNQGVDAYNNFKNNYWGNTKKDLADVGKNIAQGNVQGTIDAGKKALTNLGTNATVSAANAGFAPAQGVVESQIGKATGNFLPNGLTYAQAAQRLFGGDDSTTNPYLEHFKNKARDKNYSDAHFLYDLNQIMQSNPNVAAMVMRNAMNGDSTMADMLSRLADNMKASNPAQAKKLYDSAAYLYNQSGTLGKTMFGPGMQGSVLRSSLNSGLNSYFNGMKGDNTTQSGLNYLQKGIDQEKLKGYADAYNKNIYNPLVKDKYYEQNFYGVLNNPMAQGAMRYAMPWMSYGLPAAGLMSAMGNHSLWMPVIGGGLASAAYGGATGGGYMPNIANSRIGQAFDNITAFANKGPAYVMGMPPATAPMGSMLTGPRTYGTPQEGGPSWWQDAQDAWNNWVYTQNE